MFHQTQPIQGTETQTPDTQQELAFHHFCLNLKIFTTSAKPYHLLLLNPTKIGNYALTVILSQQRFCSHRQTKKYAVLAR